MINMRFKIVTQSYYFSSNQTRIAQNIYKKSQNFELENNEDNEKIYKIAFFCKNIWSFQKKAVLLHAFSRYASGDCIRFDRIVVNA